MRLKGNPDKLVDKINSGKVRVVNATVSTRAYRWFVALSVEEKVPKITDKAEGIVGIDVGIKDLAILSNGKVLPNPKFLTAKLKKLRRLSRAVNRKTKGPSNWKKAVKSLAKLHYRIWCTRNDYLHKFTSKLVDENAVIVTEGLFVKGMMKNGSLSRAIQDASWGEMNRQLQYKSQWRGTELVRADHYFPSSKRCSRCTKVK